MIDAFKIKALLENNSIDIRVFDVIDSTNTYLKQRPSLPITPVACIAETQTQGRGRFERNWHSPKDENIYLSLSYCFNKSLNALSGLSLVVGLSVCKAIEVVCQLPLPFRVKWPNDIMVNQKKLGGILIEVYQTQAACCQVIIGIGLNINMEKARDTEILQAWTSLRLLTQTSHDRNRLCAKLLDILTQDLSHFEQNGFGYFNEAWHQKDMLYNQEITLLFHETLFKGIGAGVNEQGHLLLNMPNHSQQAFVSGETSLLK